MEPCCLSREVESCCFPSPWEGEAARYIRIPGFTGAFLDWRHQPPMLLCFPHCLLCVSPKAYLKRPLNLIWPEIFLAVCKLCWISVYPFYFQDMPTLLICVPDLLFPPVSFFHPAVIHGYCCKNWQLETLIKGPTTRLLKEIVFGLVLLASNTEIKHLYYKRYT